MLSGEINGTGLLDLFKFLLSQNQTGTITVSNTSGSGSVQVRSGEITFAKWQEKIAEQAFYEMIKLNSLKFTFEQDYAVETGVYSADKFVEVLLAITSTATVNSGREVDYRSAYEITLNPGFRANPGSDFNAFIHRCNASGNSFKNSLE
ncbi:MAG TPA: DUF4388 domain-containing protein, partial [Caldisericia bacterium]|nr:DUF4388 domain-containing protein [Caldisericia bacterium]